jgi:hypothetical protein
MGAARRQAYLAQTGRRWLTPRQRRRDEHKANREHGRELIAALKRIPLSEVVRALNEVSPGRVTGQGS